MGIENYSKTPADNNQSPPFGWPEGMPPSGVNDSARQNMADTRTWYEDSQWVNLGYPVLFDTDDSFTFNNGVDYTAIFHTGRRIKATGTTTGTIFGTIKNSTHSGSTTVFVEWDASGILYDEALKIYIAALTKNNDSLPYLNKTAKSAVASASSINLDQVRGDLVDISGTTTIGTIILAEGQERTVRFTGILTLTNGTNLVLPSGADITTAVGDFAIFRGYDSGVVRCVAYSRASGKPVSPSDSAVNLNVSGKFSLNPATSYTIASGTITIASSNIIVQTEGAAASDDLDTINGGVANQELIISISDSAKNVSCG